MYAASFTCHGSAVFASIRSSHQGGYSILSIVFFCFLSYLELSFSLVPFVKASDINVWATSHWFGSERTCLMCSVATSIVLVVDSILQKHEESQEEEIIEEKQQEPSPPILEESAPEAALSVPSVPSNDTLDPSTYSVAVLQTISSHRMLDAVRAVPPSLPRSPSPIVGPAEDAAASAADSTTSSDSVPSRRSSLSSKEVSPRRLAPPPSPLLMTVQSHTCAGAPGSVCFPHCISLVSPSPPSPSPPPPPLEAHVPMPSFDHSSSRTLREKTAVHWLFSS